MAVDHYEVLGLPSGEERAKLTRKEIEKAYRKKAILLHPDKRLNDDQSAHEDFHRLKNSYDVLRDDEARKLYDDSLKKQRDRCHAKKRCSATGNVFGERSVALKKQREDKEKEEAIAKKLKEEIAAIRAMHAAKTTTKVVQSSTAAKTPIPNKININFKTSCGDHEAYLFEQFLATRKKNNIRTSEEYEQFFNSSENFEDLVLRKCGKAAEKQRDGKIHEFEVKF